MTSDALTAAIERRVAPEEVREALDRPVTAAEREDVVSLVRWFTTRYPNAEDRLAYVRRAYARWTRWSSRTSAKP